MRPYVEKNPSQKRAGGVAECLSSDPVSGKKKKAFSFVCLLESGLYASRAGALLLEPHLQPFLLWLI
jgi:hypothetical protein